MLKLKLLQAEKTMMERVEDLIIPFDHESGGSVDKKHRSIMS